MAGTPDEHHPIPVVLARDGFESDVGEQREPAFGGKEALDVAILAHLDRTVVVAEQESVIDLVGHVGRIGIGLPLEVAERTALTSAGPDEAVFSAVIRRGLEPLADVIWLEESCAAWPQVLVGGCQGRPKV